MPHTIRPHTKTRSGCVSCKQRRVKCDESKPRCSSCQRRDIECIYLPSARRRSRAQPAIPGPAPSEDEEDAISAPNDGPEEGYSPRNLLELRLMHHYDDSTVESLVTALDWPRAVADVMRRDVPILALEHPFLMDALLSASMLHMASTQPELRWTLPIRAYRDKASSSFHEALTSMTTNKAVRPVAIASILMRLTTFAVDRLLDRPGLWSTNAMAMAMGPCLFVNLVNTPIGTPSPYGSPYSSPYEASQLHPVNPMGLVDAGPVAPSLSPPDLEFLVQMCETENGWEYRDDILHAATGIGSLFGALASPTHECWVPSKTRLWPFQFVTPNFAQLAQREHPKALIILGYYLAFLNFLPGGWVYEGVAKGDMEKIDRLVGSAWGPYLAIPRRAVLMEDNAALKTFLLSQLHPVIAGGPSPV
ncbi:hypothetical protein GQ53DRAFT_401697 [Thozetella sp. PMI_491]|nr:hypothetical protein GQ53DRAFT_401697 [Thozetella sp. PMI_491]